MARPTGSGTGRAGSRRPSAAAFLGTSVPPSDAIDLVGAPGEFRHHRAGQEVRRPTHVLSAGCVPPADDVELIDDGRLRLPRIRSQRCSGGGTITSPRLETVSLVVPLTGVRGHPVASRQDI